MVNLSQRVNSFLAYQAQRDSTKGKINYKVGYLAYVAYNKEGFNHVHACMCQYDLEENQGKF